ncbi:MAG: hypothetical protein HOO91_06700 [Bacteroidales bacterium]|nr:hypothetical protein [Bacteroidales bacterium]
MIAFCNDGTPMLYLFVLMLADSMGVSSLINLGDINTTKVYKKRCYSEVFWELEAKELGEFNESVKIFEFLVGL